MKRGTLSPCNVRAQGVTSDVIYTALSSWTGSLFLIRILYPNLTKTIQAVCYDVITVSFPWLQLLELWRCALQDHLDCFTLAGLCLTGWSADFLWRSSLSWRLRRLMCAFLHIDAAAGISFFFFWGKKAHVLTALDYRKAGLLQLARWLIIGGLKPQKLAVLVKWIVLHVICSLPFLPHSM